MESQEAPRDSTSERIYGKKMGITYDKSCIALIV